MGKPYAQELQKLANTYSWAMTAPVEDFSASIRQMSSAPLVAVGSGGSYTAAEFLAAVHREYTSKLASAMTPLQAVATPSSFCESGVVLFSAGGRNPDVLGAFRHLRMREPNRLVVVCATCGSPLSALAANRHRTRVFEFDSPAGKDGFLATNSLLAFCVLSVRAYSNVYGVGSVLPDTLSVLSGVNHDTLKLTHERYRPLWNRPVLLVLYGPETYAAAIDVESKFTEAALGSTHLADYRNFAHGRHHWLAKRGSETAVLALVSDTDRDLARSTLSFLPSRIPVVKMEVPGRGLAACLAALVNTFLLAGSAGLARDIDPGDPGVPAFGRKIYRMRGLRAAPRTVSGLSDDEAIAIERKTGATPQTLVAQGRLDEWRHYYQNFATNLDAGVFSGLVLDYDGTLCDEAHRFKPLPSIVSRHMSRLLRAGMMIGVATGRGKSVREALRGAIHARLWQQVIVGYYNGGDVGRLDDDSHPDGTDTVHSDLEPIASVLRTDSRIALLAKLTFRRPQITVELGPATQEEEVWARLQNILHTVEAPGVVVLRSSHSIDILAPDVSKEAVVRCVSELVTPHDHSVLRIGDRGRWPGNDFLLLSGDYSLSVDEVSADPRTCWNLASPGACGIEATLQYLRAIVARPRLSRAFQYRNSRRPV